MLEQVTAEVTLLISQDPGAPALDSGGHARAAAARQMLVGAQSMANWWADNPEAHARPWSRLRWTSPGSASTAQPRRALVAT